MKVWNVWKVRGIVISPSNLPYLRYFPHLLMDIPYGDDRNKAWVTNVGLITSDGPHGPNVMAAEWTHMINYSPATFVVCIGLKSATLKNIQETKEFGLHLASHKHRVLSSIAGGNSGKDTQKIDALKEMGFSFYQAKHIKAPMIEDAALSVECKLTDQHNYGDHVMCIGEAIDASADPNQNPIAFHSGKYFSLEQELPKPSEEERARMKELIDHYKK